MTQDYQQVVGYLIKQLVDQGLLNANADTRAGNTLSGYYTPNAATGGTPTFAREQWMTQQSDLDRQYLLDVAKVGVQQAQLNYQERALLASQRGPKNAIAYNYQLNNRPAPVGREVSTDVVPTPIAPSAESAAATKQRTDMARAQMLAGAYNAGNGQAYRDAGGTAVDTRFATPAPDPSSNLTLGLGNSAGSGVRLDATGATVPTGPAPPAGVAGAWGYADGGEVRGGDLESTTGGTFPPNAPAYEEPSFEIGGQIPPEAPPAPLDNISFDADGGEVSSDPSGYALGQYIAQMMQAGRGDEARQLLAGHGYSEQASTPAAAQPSVGAPAPAAAPADPAAASFNTWYDNGDLGAPVQGYSNESPAPAAASAPPSTGGSIEHTAQSPADIQRAVSTLSGNSLTAYLRGLPDAEYMAWASSRERAAAGEPVWNTVAAAGAGLASAGGLGVINAALAPLLARGESVASKLGEMGPDTIRSLISSRVPLVDRLGPIGSNAMRAVHRADGGPVAPVAVVGDSHSGRPTGFEELAIALPPRGGQSRMMIEPLSATNDPRETQTKIRWLDRMDDGGILSNVGYSGEDIGNSPTVKKITGQMPTRAFGANMLDYSLPGSTATLPQANRLNYATYSRLQPSEQQYLQGIIETPREMGGLGLDFTDYLDTARRAAPTGVTFGGPSRYG